MDNNKYDRQVRFWSESGQEALRSSHVLIAGISLVSLEAAKGLILAGIGSLTLVTGAHFKPSATSLFSADMHTQQEQLQSLNTDSVVSSVTHLNEVVRDVTLVIQSCACEYALSHLTARFSAPVLTVGSYMLQGFVRLTASDLFVLQPHPEAGLSDLRVTQTSLNEWSEFRDFCDSFNLDELTDAEHAHVPYFVLLVKAYRKGMTLGDLRKALTGMARSPQEENFEEARKYARLAIKAETDIPAGVRELIDLQKQQKADDTSPFWQLIGALGKYIDSHGILPVSGEVPDMIASTDSFVRLKRIYAARLQDDANELASYLPEGTNTHTNLLQTFCRNSRVVKYIYQNKDYSPQLLETEKLCHEHGEREIYAVASLLGGIAVQEATKIIMHQYMPILGVAEYDAASGELIVKNTEQYTVLDAERL